MSTDSLGNFGSLFSAETALHLTSNTFAISIVLLFLRPSQNHAILGYTYFVRVLGITLAKLDIGAVAKLDTHGVVGTNVVVGDQPGCVVQHTLIDLMMWVCCNRALASTNTSLGCHLPRPDGCREEKANQGGAQLWPGDSASSQARWVQRGKSQPGWRAALAQNQRQPPPAIQAPASPRPTVNQLPAP